MPDVGRSDSTHRPRVSFNRDVHVKRIGRAEGALVGEAPVRKERPSKRELARVLQQADAVACSSARRFSTLPTLRSRKTPRRSLSFRDRSPSPPKRNILKKSHSDSESGPTECRKKQQLSPIIEDDNMPRRTVETMVKRLSDEASHSHGPPRVVALANERRHNNNMPFSYTELAPTQVVYAEVVSSGGGRKQTVHTSVPLQSDEDEGLGLTMERGRADGMDARRKDNDSLEHSYHLDARTYKSNVDSNDLSLRRDRLESRIESQRKDRFVNTRLRENTDNRRKINTDASYNSRRDFLNSQLDYDKEVDSYGKKDLFADSGIEVDYRKDTSNHRKYEETQSNDTLKAKIVISGPKVTHVQPSDDEETDDGGDRYYRSHNAFTSTRLVQEQRRTTDVLPTSTVLIRHYAAPEPEPEPEPEPDPDPDYSVKHVTADELTEEEYEPEPPKEKVPEAIIEKPIKKAPKKKQVSAMDKVKQLFSRSSSDTKTVKKNKKEKKKEEKSKSKEENKEEDPLTSRYTEYKGSTVESDQETITPLSQKQAYPPQRDYSSSRHKTSQAPLHYQREQSPSSRRREPLHSSPPSHRRERSSPSYHREQSPAVHRREHSPSSHRKEHTPQSHHREQSPLLHRREHTPPSHHREQSPLFHHRERSSPLYHREHSPPSRRRERTPPSRHREQSPPLHRRERTPLTHHRDHSPPPQRRERTPLSHNRDHSPPPRRIERTPPSHNRDHSPPPRRKEHTPPLHHKGQSPLFRHSEHSQHHRNQPSPSPTSLPLQVPIKDSSSQHRWMTSDSEEQQQQAEFVRTRQRLATPTSSPSVVRAAQSSATLTRINNQKNKEQHAGGWFKSLDRLTKKNRSKPKQEKQQPEKERPNVQEDEIRPTHYKQNMSGSNKNLRFFGDTDQESVTSIPPPMPLQTHRRYKSNSNVTSSSNRLQVPRGPSLRNHRRHHHSAGDIATSSAESTTEGDSSQQSQRSVVYLHAATVGDIPTPARRAQSREELSSVASSHLQPQVRTVSRSISVLAPWKPKHRREGMEVHYDKEDNNKNYIKNGKPPKVPVSQQTSINSSTMNRINRRKNAENIKQRVNKATSIESLNHSSSRQLPDGRGRIKKHSTLHPSKSIESMNSQSVIRRGKPIPKKNSALNASAMELNSNRNYKSNAQKKGSDIKSSSKVSRSVSMPKDNRVTAGWFKLRNKKQGT